MCMECVVAGVASVGIVSHYWSKIKTWWHQQHSGIEIETSDLALHPEHLQLPSGMPLLYKGQRVRIVDMRGCMATDRHVMYEGVIQGFKTFNVYGSDSAVEYVDIVVEKGGSHYVPSTAGFWTRHTDGVMEYRY